MRQQRLALLRSNLERSWKPQIQGPVDQRIAKEKQQQQRQQRYAHRAQHHLHFEA